MKFCKGIVPTVTLNIFLIVNLLAFVGLRSCFITLNLNIFPYYRTILTPKKEKGLVMKYEMLHSFKLTVQRKNRSRLLRTMQIFG